MKALATRRALYRDPAPEFVEAVQVTRFWALVNTTGDCWEWQGDKDRDGYGVFSWNGRSYGAHRLALSFATGESMGPGLETCHACDNPGCCNPDHLRFDTRAGNVADMVARGRDRNGHKRLTDDEVRVMRERRANGASQKVLARDFGVSESLVTQIVRGLRRADAPGPIHSKNAIYATTKEN